MKKQSSPAVKANGKKATVPAASATTTTEQLINTTAPVATSDAAAETFEDGNNNSDQDDQMSDDEDSAVLLRMESDVSLPRASAPVKQLIMEKLPGEARIHQQSKELISNLCMHFLSHLAEQSNEFCSAQNKKTVCPDHVLDALTKMNLTRYFPKLAALDEDQMRMKAAAANESNAGSTTRKKRGKSASSAAANQTGQMEMDSKKMKAAILTRLNQSMEGCSKMRGVGKSRADREDRGDDALTDEQRNLEQEKLFREAREQYDQQQMAAQQAAAEQSTSQQQQMSGGQYDHNGEVGSNMLMNYDSNAPADGNFQVMDNNMPPFNPTDYFRDMIFSTDFMAELDPPVYDANEPMDAPPIDQIVNEEDAEMADENQEAVGVTVEDVEDENKGKDIQEVMMPLQRNLSLVLDVPEEFSFDEDELQALEQAAQTVMIKHSTTGATNAAASSEAGAGRQRAGTVRNNDNNTKPKEQNDQEMEERLGEESKSKDQPKD